MKQFLFGAFAFALLSPTLTAQNFPLQEFIEQHKNDPGVSHAFLSKDLFEVTTKSKLNNETWNGLHQVVKNLGSLHILAADSIPKALDYYKEVMAIIPDHEFDELLTVRHDSENVRIWAKSEEGLVTDLVLLVGSAREFVLVCFAGNLELGNIGALAELFEAKEVEQLTKASIAVSVDFSISPNPSQGEFMLSYFEEQDSPASIIIMDQSGRLVTNLILSGASSQQIILPDLSSGTYWLQLKTKQGKIGLKQFQLIKR